MPSAMTLAARPGIETAHAIASAVERRAREPGWTLRAVLDAMDRFRMCPGCKRNGDHHEPRCWIVAAIRYPNESPERWNTRPLRGVEWSL